MLEIKQNEYLSNNKQLKEYLSQKQLKYLRDRAVKNDDSEGEIEKKKEFKILLKQRRKFQWESRSLNFMSSRRTRQYSSHIQVKFNRYLFLLRNVMKKLKRHLTPQPPYILTPDGSIKMIWDLICLSVVIFEMVSIPFSISFDIDFSGDFANVSTGVFAFDIFLNFNTGVYQDGALQMNRKSILKDYLSFWFWIDIISTFPYDTIIDESQSLIQSTKLLRLFKFLKFVRVLKLLRLAKLKKTLDKMNEFIQTSRGVGVAITFFKLFVFVLFFAHVLGCVFHFMAKQEQTSWLGDEQNGSWENRYIDSLYWGVATMTTVGYGDISPQTFEERLLGIFLLLVACGGFAFTMNSIGFALSSLAEKSNVRKQKVSLLNKYMKKAKIADVLQNKVRRYLEFAWDSHSLILSDITKLLPEELQNDMIEQVNGKLLGHIDLFWQQHTTRFLIQGVIPILIEKLFLPEEIVFNENPTPQYDMFMIQRGDVDIYFEKPNTVIDKKQKYDYFGEISFYTNQQRSASAISRSFSHIFTLDQLQFQEILKLYPKDQQQYFKVKEGIIFNKDYYLIQVRCYVCQMDDHIAQDCPALHFKVQAPHFLSFLHQYHQIQQSTYLRKDRIDYNARQSNHQIQQSQIRFFHINSKIQNFLNSKGLANTFFMNYYNLDQDGDEVDDETPSRKVKSYQSSLFGNKNRRKFDSLHYNYEEISQYTNTLALRALSQRNLLEDHIIDQLASERFNELLEQVDRINEKKRQYQHSNFSFSLIPDFDKIAVFQNFCENYNIDKVLKNYDKIQRQGAISQIPPKYQIFGYEEFSSYLEYYCFQIKQHDLLRYFTKCRHEQNEEFQGFENFRRFNLTRVEKKKSNFIRRNTKFRSVVFKVKTINSIRNSISQISL